MERLELFSSSLPYNLFSEPSTTELFVRSNLPTIKTLSDGSRPQLHGRFSLMRDELLTDEQSAIKVRILLYLKYGNKKLLEPCEREVIALFNGESDIDNIKNFEDTRTLLELVKIIDLALSEHNRNSRIKHDFIVRTYHIRTKILEIDSSFSTNEIYTKTLDQKKLKNKIYLSKSENWIAERVGYQAKIFCNQYVKTGALSKRLSMGSHCFMIRGPSASGKSEYVNQYFKSISEENELLAGTLDPDEIKLSLKQIAPYPVNVQVHPEGIALFQNLKMGIKSTPLNVIMEGRFSKIDEINEVIDHEHQKLRRIFLVDIAHASLSLLLRRVLTREHSKKAPCLGTQDIVKGYVESIIHRKKLLDIVKIHPTIEFFNLYFVDECENTHLIVQKEKYKFKILSEELLLKSCREPLSSEIENQLQEVIDKNKFPQLEKWHGMKIGKAVDKNAALNSAKSQLFVEEGKWGEIRIQPFDGSWISDYPFLIEHLDSEHILDIRQSDSEGIGLHWSANKFPEGPNPQFSQDARVGNASKRGLQMKLGYFLISPALFETHLADPLSAVSKQLFDHETGYFRFFVHPEAYDNFAQLHFCPEAVFVKPENSEFMGTPTSSYRSWVIRDVSGLERKMPFIVKMGVGSQRNRGKFLPREDILKSINAQNNINKIEASDYIYFFPETIGITLRKGLSEEDSGLIIREIPISLLRGERRMLSFSALMSAERNKKENHGLCNIVPEYLSLGSYPLIYEIIENALQKNLVRSSAEFINEFLIKMYFRSIEELVFKNGFSLSPHGQNLCFVLNHEGVPVGFAYRDFEGISEGGKNYIESYSWFYRYHCIVKLLNVMTHSSKQHFKPTKGAPSQLGFAAPLKERNLYPLLKGSSQHDIYFSYSDYKSVLDNLDNTFLKYLSKYFSIENIPELKVGTIPAAEGSSAGELELARLNKRLWQNRLSTLKTPLEYSKEIPRENRTLTGLESDSNLLNLEERLAEIASSFKADSKPEEKLQEYPSLNLEERLAEIASSFKLDPKF